MTRFPKSGRGRKWTVAEFKALPRKGDALADGDGLVGVVRLSTDEALRVHFRYGYKREGKRAWHYCGTWPSAPLDAIRRTRDHARDTLKRGLDPNAKREADHTGRRRAPARRGGIGVRAVRAVASRRRTAPGRQRGAQALVRAGCVAGAGREARATADRARCARRVAHAGGARRQPHGGGGASQRQANVPLGRETPAMATSAAGRQSGGTGRDREDSRSRLRPEQRPLARARRP